MAKKINNYSWIHELNSAAMKAKLLSESKIYSNQVQLNEAKMKKPKMKVGTNQTIWK
jgi:hypothetical protein